MANSRDNESEPLLGRPGDATQHDQPIYTNLWIGTAFLTQAGIWILTAIVWSAVFENELGLFSAHPLLNTAGLFLAVQAILILQPTVTPAQKTRGTQLHALLHSIGLAALVAGLIIIEYNKFDHNGAHFGTAHNIFGVIFYVLLVLQAVVGVTQYWYPNIYGGVDEAKAVWKYHRVGGYVAATVGLATVCAAVETPYNDNVGGIRMWSVVVASVLVLAGILPRIKLQKLGLK